LIQTTIMKQTAHTPAGRLRLDKQTVARLGSPDLHAIRAGKQQAESISRPGTSLLCCIIDTVSKLISCQLPCEEAA